MEASFSGARGRNRVRPGHGCQHRSESDTIRHRKGLISRTNAIKAKTVPVVRFVLMRSLAMLRSLVLTPLLALGCTADKDPPAAAAPEPSVDIGLPGGDDGL